MAFSRYTRTPKIKMGTQYGTPDAVNQIRSAISHGTMKTTETIVRGVERLDTLAGAIYGDARYWWILAAASNIGWCLQVPVGTIIKIPDLNEVAQLIS